LSQRSGVKVATHSIGSPVVDEERWRSGYWLQFVLPLLTFSALRLMTGWREGIQPVKNPVPLIPRGLLLDQVEEELTQVQLGKLPFNGSSSNAA